MGSKFSRLLNYLLCFHKMLIRVDHKDKREFYIAEAIKQLDYPS